MDIPQRGLPADLDVPYPFDLFTFCETMATRRDRELRLLPTEFGHGMSGLWVPYPDIDVVYYEEKASRIHRQHIVLHEIAHMILEHTHDPDLVREYRNKLGFLIDLETFDHVFARTSYVDERERQAETLAGAILEKGRRAPDRPSRGTGVINRLEQSFG
jgi:Zn-dependent peptidase ImmA (M78 family)